jgi:Ca-activated chloride channel family protein
MPASAVVAAVLLGGGILVGSFLALRGDSTADGGCDDGVELAVSAAPALAAPLAEAVERYRAGSPEVDGRCVTVTLTSRASPETVADLSAGWTAPSAGPRPDVWIPESASWLALARTREAGAKLLPSSGTTIASSPVVIAMPRPMAEATDWPAFQLGWAGLAANNGNAKAWRDRGHPEWGPFRVGLADPASSSASLAAVLNVVSVRRGTPVESMTPDTFTRTPVRTTILTFERGAERVPASVDALLTGLRQADRRGEALTHLSAFPASEHDVVAYNRGRAGGGAGGAPAVPLAAAYPPDGLALEQIPFVPLRHAVGDESRSRAAEDFLRALRGETGRSALTAAGFRTPDGKNPGLAERDGFLADLPGKTQPTVAGATLAAAAQTFAGIHQRGATLAVFDTSGSMAQPVSGSGGKTKMRVAVDAVLAALPLLADDSELGLWQFSTDLDGDRDYVELLPIGPMAERIGGRSRREYFASAARELTPTGDTGLYDTALAAFAELTAQYVPGKPNQVVLITDGVNDDPGSITLDDLVAQLRREFDPKRPVRIITIAYGAEADEAALGRISSATGAKSYQSLDPKDINQVLVEALLDR